MFRQEKQIVTLVWYDFFAIWVLPIIIGIINALLNVGALALFGYAVRNYAWCVLLLSALLISVAKEVGDDTPHLRNTSTELRQYFTNWLKVVVIGNAGAVLLHYAVWVVFLLPYVHLSLVEKVQYNDIFVALALIAFVLSVVQRMFLMPPITDQAGSDPSRPVVIRGTGMTSGNQVAGRAWGRGKK